MLHERLRDFGVVGAGGAGFPTYVKAQSQVEFLIANGAECEPLIHKDAELMKHFPKPILSGMEAMMDATGAKTGKFGIKTKNAESLEALRHNLSSQRIEFVMLGDFYPSGDEYELVYTATGRLIPPAGIPLQVGCVVNNVETLYNVNRAEQGVAVIKKTLTIAGAVNHPLTLTVPIGATFREIIEATGGFSVPDPVLVIGGLMMGQTAENLDEPITKTTTGVVVLPRTHHVIERKLKPYKQQAQIGKSACDQCRYCTEYCPRFLLGYDVQPHAVMRSLAFTATDVKHWNELAALCCACGLCTLYGCPEELYPKEACDNSKNELRKANIKWTGKMEVKPHPMRDGRRVPIKSLMKKMAIQEYDHPAHLEQVNFKPNRAMVALKQNAGAPNISLVKAGDHVSVGQQIGEIPEKTMGAVIHAPFAGVVQNVTNTHIILNRS